MIFGINTTRDISKLYHNFEISLGVFMPNITTKSCYYLYELTGQTIPVIMRFSLLIKTIQPDLSNPKSHARRRWLFNKTSWKKHFSSFSKWMVRPASSDFRKAPLTSALSSSRQGTWALFSKVTIINGPVKLLLFTCKVEVSTVLQL